MFKSLLITLMTVLCLATPAYSSLPEPSLMPPTYEESVNQLAEKYLEFFKAAIQYVAQHPDFGKLEGKKRDEWLTVVLNEVAKSLLYKTTGVVEKHAVMVNLALEYPEPQIVIVIKFTDVEEPKVLVYNVSVPKTKPLQKGPVQCQLTI